MSMVQKVKEIDKMTSKYFIPFSIVFFAFAFGWNYAGGETIFSSLMQDISIFFILINQGVIISYLTWYKWLIMLDLNMNDQIVEIIGWLGFALVSMGYYFNAKKKLYCFYIWGLGNAIYILYGFIISAFPIIAMSVFVLGMNIYGYLNWVKDS